MPENLETKYPLLGELLSLRNLSLKATYTNRQVGEIFGVTIRAIQARIKNGDLVARNLPGRATFLPADLEEYLNKSRKVR